MSLLNCLLGGDIQALKEMQAMQNQEILMQAELQQQYHPGHYCLHGKDCPVCLEVSKKNEEARMQREEDLKKKKLDYELRCKKYMIEFRRKRDN